MKEMGGAPRNPAPRNHFFVWIVKPSGCHCTDAFGGTKPIVECRPLLGALPLSLSVRILNAFLGAACHGLCDGTPAILPKPRDARLRGMERRGGSRSHKDF